jgi:hypothetical protein
MTNPMHWTNVGKTNMVARADLDAFQARLQAKLTEWHLLAQNVGSPPEVSIEPGTKYARIVVSSAGPQRSAYGFIDLTTGDLLKADGWKKPAKHVRGNIYRENPLAGCTPYGMQYLRS